VDNTADFFFSLYVCRDLPQVAVCRVGDAAELLGDRPDKRNEFICLFVKVFLESDAPVCEV
jgi:hypothetical protein